MTAAWTLTFKGATLMDATEGTYSFVPQFMETGYQVEPLANSKGAVVTELATGAAMMEMTLRFRVKSASFASIWSRIDAAQVAGTGTLVTPVGTFTHCQCMRPRVLGPVPRIGVLGASPGAGWKLDVSLTFVKVRA